MVFRFLGFWVFRFSFSSAWGFQPGQELRVMGNVFVASEFVKKLATEKGNFDTVESTTGLCSG